MMEIENKFWFSIIVGAIVLLIVSIVLYATLKEDEQNNDTSSIPVILEGNKIEIKYTVRIDGCGGVVFDSNRDEIINGSGVERSIFFDKFPVWPGTYLVGEHPGRLSFPGFEKNIKGHKVGDVFQFTIEAMGDLEHYEHMVVEIPVVETIPLYETMLFDDFTSLFGIDMPMPGMVTEHPLWKWEIEIFSIGEKGNVTIFHRPEKNDKVDALPWSSTVSDISSEDDTITLTHDTSNRSVMNIIVEPFDYKEYHRSFLEMPRGGHITQMDAERIVIDFNDIRAGKNICFQIEIVEIIE